MVNTLKKPKKLPPTCIWTRGGRFCRQVENIKKNNLQFAFERGRGGGGGGGVKTPKRSTSSSRLDVREVEDLAVALKQPKGPSMTLCFSVPNSSTERL